MPVFYLGSGYVFVSINHRLLGPATGMLDIPYDTAAALAWVHGNIGDFGGDASNVFVVGFLVRWSSGCAGLLYVPICLRCMVWLSSK